MNQGAKITLIAVIAAVLTGGVVFGATFWYFQNKDDNLGKSNQVSSNQTNTTSDNTTTSDVQSLGMYNTQDYDYDVVNLESFPVQQNLTRKKVGSSKAETIMNNAALEKAITELADSNRPKLLVEVSEPTASRYVYYTVVLDGTEDTGKDLYALDTETETFKKMSVSNDISANTGGLTFVQKVSSDGNKLAIMNNLDEKSKDLYVIDLATDSMTKVVSLTGTETFEGGSGGLSSYTDIRWKSNTELSYDVFDKSQKESHFPDTSQEYKKIATRTVEVK